MWKVGLLHMADAQNVTVKIIKARNVGGIFKSSQKDQLRVYCKICLVPGKQQKQQTKDVEGTQDPVFKEAFLFKGKSNDNQSKWRCITPEAFLWQFTWKFDIFPEELRWIGTTRQLVGFL